MIKGILQHIKGLYLKEDRYAALIEMSLGSLDIEDMLSPNLTPDK